MPVGIKFTKPVSVTDAVLPFEIQALAELKALADAALLRFEEQQERVVKLLEQQGRKSATNGSVRARLVIGSSTRYDERGLAKALGAPVWNKVTKKVLDKGKLEDAVDKGDIDLNVVAQYATVTPNKPYIRLTPVTADDSE